MQSHQTKNSLFKRCISKQCRFI